jgi:signal transduction histidine kinase
VAIERVASNLVSNAVKYTPRGGRVDLELEARGDDVIVTVLDTGPGIDAELATRLFGRFERARGEDRRKVGTGLGLALVQELVTAHGGSIEAVAREGGRGTMIRVVLPGAVSTATPASPPRSDIGAPRITSSIQSGTVLVPSGTSRDTILVADDDAGLAEAIARLLGEHYRVIVALDGAAAVELVKEHKPNLLITDVDMPLINGIELARRFREITGDPLAPVIIVSAVIDLGTRVAGLDAGAIDYITKPFDPLELEARVRAQLRARDLTLSLQRAEHLSLIAKLSAGLAHELRNPANGITNAIEPLRQLLPPELTRPETMSGKLINVLSSCGERIGFLSRQLLAFAGGALEMRPAQMKDLLTTAVNSLQPTLSGLEVRTDIHLDGPVMCAGPLLIQVFSNLLENAAHAAGRGGWITVSGHKENGSVLLEFSDSGPGVPKDLRDRVFEPFFTTKPAGKGTGLGLPLSRAIAQQHGGALDIRERDDRPIFVLELPG